MSNFQDYINTVLDQDEVRKMLIIDLYHAAIVDGMVEFGTTFEDFKNELQVLWTTGEIILARADMPALWGIEGMTASEIKRGNATVHLVVKS